MVAHEPPEAEHVGSPPMALWPASAGGLGGAAVSKQWRTGVMRRYGSLWWNDGNPTDQGVF